MFFVPAYYFSIAPFWLLLAGALRAREYEPKRIWMPWSIASVVVALIVGSVWVAYGGSMLLDFLKLDGSSFDSPPFLFLGVAVSTYLIMSAILLPHTLSRAWYLLKIRKGQ